MWLCIVQDFGCCCVVVSVFWSFPGYECSVPVKRCNFLNLTDCSTCSDNLPLSHQIHITDDCSSKTLMVIPLFGQKLSWYMIVWPNPIINGVLNDDIYLKRLRYTRWDITWNIFHYYCVALIDIENESYNIYNIMFQISLTNIQLS